MLIVEKFGYRVDLLAFHFRDVTKMVDNVTKVVNLSSKFVNRSNKFGGTKYLSYLRIAVG